MAIIQFDDGEQGILEKNLHSLVYYEYGEAYFGSYRGMRYRVAREPLSNVHFVPPAKRDPAVLRVTIWPEPFGYASTPGEEKTVKDFEFSEEGLAQITPYLNAYHEEHFRTQE